MWHFVRSQTAKLRMLAPAPRQWLNEVQVLYGILVQHFATVAGRTPLELDHLDAMTQVLAPATAEVLPSPRLNGSPCLKFAVPEKPLQALWHARGCQDCTKWCKWEHRQSPSGSSSLSGRKQPES